MVISFMIYISSSMRLLKPDRCLHPLNTDLGPATFFLGQGSTGHSNTFVSALWLINTFFEYLILSMVKLIQLNILAQELIYMKYVCIPWPVMC